MDKIQNMIIPLTLVWMSKTHVRLSTTNWNSTWIHKIRPSKTSGITKAPIVNFGFPTFAKMKRPCIWSTSVLFLSWNCARVTSLFSALRQTSALGLKCSITHRITPPSPTSFTCIWWASSKPRSKSVFPITGIASRISKTWPWQA